LEIAIKLTESEGRDAPATAASIVAERVERFSLMFVSVVTGAAMVLKELPKQTGIR
jgi:hypothetical protein